MKLIPDCHDMCCVCAAGMYCLAGNGDNDFAPASKEKIIENLDYGHYQSDAGRMVRYLKEEFNYEYQMENWNTKKEDSKKPEENKKSQDTIKAREEYLEWISSADYLIQKEKGWIDELEKVKNISFPIYLKGLMLSSDEINAIIELKKKHIKELLSKK